MKCRQEKNPALAWIDPFPVDASQKLYYEEILVGDMPYMTDARYVEGKGLYVGYGKDKFYIFDKEGKVSKEFEAKAGAYAVTGDGDIYALSQEYRKNDKETVASNGKVTVYSLDGKREREITIPDYSFTAEYESQPLISVDIKGQIYILYPETAILVLDDKGKQVKEVKTKANLFIDMGADGNIVTGEYYNRSGAFVAEVRKLDAQHNEKWHAQLFGQSMVKSPVVKGEYLYYMDEKGVQRVDKEGKGSYILLYDDHIKIVNTGSAYMCNIDSERSDMKKEAWEFLKYFFSEQFYDDYMTSLGSIPKGFSINKNVNKKVLPRALEYARAYPDVFLATEELLNNALDIAVKSAETYTITDRRIKSIIISGLEGHFLRGMSIEDTAKEIQNKVNIYMNE